MLLNVRVMTWNVHGLRARRRVVAVIRCLDPDVLLVQEVPRLLWPSWSARLLARSCGMALAVGGRAARGNALLVRRGLPVSGATVVALAHRPRLHRRAIVSAAVAGLPVTGTHLSLDAGERAEQVADLVAAVPPGPAVVAGDLNEPASGPTWTTLEDAGLGDVGPVDAATFPSRGTRIDAVLVRGLPATPVAVVDTDASDHRPVVVDISWPILGR